MARARLTRAQLGEAARWLLRGRRASLIAWTLAGALALGVVVIAGAEEGYTAKRPRLLSGAAWLPSTKAGQLALLDGATAEVAAQVKVSSGGGDLDVVQQDSHAYVVNTSRGFVRRVNGATLAVTPALAGGDPGARPLPDAGKGLRVFAGPGVLYAVDTEHGVLVQTDPVTLARRGDLQPLAADAAPESTVLDDHGALWALDDRTGDLNILRAGHRVTRRGVKAPGPGRLVVAGGAPVLVDTAARTASLLDRDSGEPASAVPLELRDGDEVAISGSPHSARLYVVSRGVLTICELKSTNCGRAISLGRSGDGFGAAVENGGRLFVPNYVTGRVWIVDLATSKVVAQPEVLDPPTRFQLLTRDGVVFFNDPASERAGIIRLDGDVLKVPKYDPGNPDKGLTERPDDEGGLSPEHPTERPDDPESSPAPTPSSDVSVPPDSSPPPDSGGTPPSQPSTGGPKPLPSTGPSGPSTPPPPTTSPPPSTSPPPGPPTVSISLSQTTATTDEPVTLRATAPTGKPSPTGATWTFGDGKTGSGVLTSHAWTTPDTFQINVTATFPGGRTAVAAASVQITERPVLTVQTPLGGKVTGGGIDCAPTCTKAADPGETITLTAQPSTGFRVRGWGGACSGTAATCVVTMDAGKTVSVQFARDSLALIPLAPAAAWRTGVGPIPWSGTSAVNGGPDANPDGFALLRPAGSLLLEDRTDPEYLETHPQWVNNGWIEGDFTLPAPVVPGDRFRTTLGFMAVANPPSAGEADFVVLAVFPNGSVLELSRTHDRGDDGVMHPLDVDLSQAVGATKIRLRAEAGAKADQDWCSWVNPRIEG
ncbi:InlB B-repeat-containing protein [Streptomyces echinatus]|uniref:PKD domain-containing protein n=1 Tax=Streptomyces echinatus TaxID=67293 RepID=A0A7W9US67_9ACTN|nr:PKD domain-containing protein [Streptomyces echinatus]MBB5928289.1 hypothetical protein [Streptomyces echinatus]